MTSTTSDAADAADRDEGGRDRTVDRADMGRVESDDASVPPSALPEVDVIVPLRDEIDKLPAFLAMLEAQTLRPRRIIVADGMSTDGSRDLLARVAADDDRLLVLDNVDRIVPAALNLALLHVQSPLVARMDTHALYEPDYLETVVTTLAERPSLSGVGGAMRTSGRGEWGLAIASTLGRSFGLGGARHRVGGAEGPIAHVFSGCYRTDKLREIGGWDSRYRANEDFEADTRLLEAGGELWLQPEAMSTWFVRESVPALAKQMWRYGYYKAHTLRDHPSSLKLRQLAPPALVLAFGVGAILQPRRTVGAVATYVVLGGTLGAVAAHQDGHSVARGAVIPPVVHISWGAGLLVGLVGVFRPKGRLGCGDANVKARRPGARRAG